MDKDVSVVGVDSNLPRHREIWNSATQQWHTETYRPVREEEVEVVTLGGLADRNPNHSKTITEIFIERRQVYGTTEDVQGELAIASRKQVVAMKKYLYGRECTMQIELQRQAKHRLARERSLKKDSRGTQLV